MKPFLPDTPMPERLRAFWRWFKSGACKIKDRNGHLVAIRPNNMQRRLHRSLLRQALKGQPIRLIDLKARKEGASTYFQALGYFLAKATEHWATCTVAHTTAASQDIFGIGKRIARYDPEEPQATPSGPGCLVFAHDSTFIIRTAGSDNVLSGATINFFHGSETAKWQGSANFVKGQLASLLGSVPKVPNSIAVLESTANMLDNSGQFRAMWDAAKGHDSPYEPFFSPWIEEPTYRIPGATLSHRTPYEERYSKLLGITDEQWAWRRAQIAGDCVGDERYFCQEYPLTEEEAWQSPSGLIFPMLTMEKHNRHHDIAELLAGGFRIYRGFDWGDADAFVCVWIAHRPGEPGFSVDVARCPKTWSEHTGYAWDENGRPRDARDHTIDSHRYVVNYYGLTGYVHIYREFYQEESAAHGMSILDLAKEVNTLGAGEPISGSVGDRNRPGTVLLLARQGTIVEPYYHPAGRGGAERGEKVDGIMTMQALMNATLPLRAPPRVVPWLEIALKQRRDSAIRYGLDATTMIAALDKRRNEVNESEDDMFGHCV